MLMTMHDNYRKVVIAILLCLLGFLFIRLPGTSIITIFHDDSFFYLKTAANIADGKGSTFDEINVTNGYHPLYMTLLVVISKIFAIKGLNGIYAVLFFDNLIFVMFLLIIDRLYRRCNLADAFRLPLGLCFISFMGINDFGLESRLTLVLAWLFLSEIYSLLYVHHQTNWGTAAIFSVLLFLARIDMVLLIVFSIVPALLTCERPYKQPWLRVGIGLLAASAGGIGCYLLGNVFFFSAPTTISSHLKMGWPGMLEGSWTDLGGPGVRIRLLACLAASSICFFEFIRSWWANRLAGTNETGTNLFFAAMNAYVFCYMMILICFARGVGGWYFLCPFSIILFSIVGLFSRQKWQQKWIGKILYKEAFLIIVSLFLIVAGMAYAEKKTSDMQHDVCAISDWLRKNIGDATPIFQVDASGKTGYLSGRRIVNGDGLINSWEYIEYLRQGKLAEYFRKYLTFPTYRF